MPQIRAVMNKTLTTPGTLTNWGRLATTDHQDSQPGGTATNIGGPWWLFAVASVVTLTHVTTRRAS
jgi:hypothetical protein